jgi:Protein of unknown function (DUF3788)
MTPTKPVKKDEVTPAVPSNAFAGKADTPEDRELRLALGPASALWDKLVVDLQRKHIVNTQEWGSSSHKAGWSLRLKQKDRIILYLIPLPGSFQAALVLGDKGVKAARQSKLPERVLKTIAGAKRYAEGTGIRLPVTAPEDLAAIEELAQIKIDN